MTCWGAGESPRGAGGQRREPRGVAAGAKFQPARTNVPEVSGRPLCARPLGLVASLGICSQELAAAVTWSHPYSLLLSDRTRLLESQNPSVYNIRLYF